MISASAFIAVGGSSLQGYFRGLNASSHRQHVCRKRSWAANGHRQVPVFACVGPTNRADRPDEAMDSSAKEMRWCEICFESLEIELAAVDEYEREEDLPRNDPWPIFLRGAAYEHWGRPRLAMAQYDLVRHAKGLLQIPDLWMRKAYNAFKLGDVAEADAYHVVADTIRAEAVGNQMHFSFWFEENFAEFKPRHNGPIFPLQAAICRYCADRKAMASVRVSLAPLIFAKAGCAIDLQHATLWMLAACAVLKSTDLPVEPTSLNPDDIELGRRVFDGQAQVIESLSPVARVFLDPSSEALAEADSSVIGPDGQPNEHSITRGLYLALYHDAFTKDERARDRWLDFVASKPQPQCTHGYKDFMYFVAQNRLSVPSDSNENRPSANL